MADQPSQDHMSPWHQYIHIPAASTSLAEHGLLQTLSSLSLCVMLAKMGYSGRLALLLSQGCLPLLVSENKACEVSPAKTEISQSRRGLGSAERGRPHPKGFEESRSDGILMVMTPCMSGWVAIEEACQSPALQKKILWLQGLKITVA